MRRGTSPCVRGEQAWAGGPDGETCFATDSVCKCIHLQQYSPPFFPLVSSFSVVTPLPSLFVYCCYSSPSSLYSFVSFVPSSFPLSRILYVCISPFAHHYLLLGNDFSCMGLYITRLFRLKYFVESIRMIFLYVFFRILATAEDEYPSVGRSICIYFILFSTM